MTEFGLLTIPLASIRRELSQIRSWIQPRPEHPFGEPEVVARFGGQLRGLVNGVATELREIENDLARNEGRAAWARYARLQREVLPQVANELLAVIGGRYLSTRNLDDMHPLDGRRDRAPDASTLSFSSVARELLDDLSERTNAAVGSLLIVGEERQVPIGTGIVRLRFPACDVWNLPFTAHEYGYLVARSNEDSPIFREFRDQVELYVDPRRHKSGGLEVPPQQSFRRDVQEFWGSKDPLPEDEREIPPALAQLRERQVAHLCRLFGDAFATYFVGPAYVQALLYLRFRPDKQLVEPGRMLPAFVERFVVALETLQRMDEDRDRYRDIDFGGLDTPFVDMFDESDGLRTIWKEFLATAGVRVDPYDDVKNRLDPWIDRIWPAVTDPRWRDVDDQADVYPCWREALGLVEVLKNGSLPHHTRPRAWALVNAAWIARCTGGDDLTVERTALRLLDRSDDMAVRAINEKARPAETEGVREVGHQRRQVPGRAAAEGPAPVPFSQRPEQAGLNLNPLTVPGLDDEDRRAVQSVLFDGPVDLLRKFRESISSKIGDDDVRDYLLDHPAALEAYRRLLGSDRPFRGRE